MDGVRENGWMGWGKMDGTGIMEGRKAFQVIVYFTKYTTIEDLHCPMLLYKGVPRLEHQNQWQ